MSESLRRQISAPASLFAFEATARLNSFRAAALELNVTQPSISYQIRNLERHLSVELFERRGRNLNLTAEGEVLYDAVRRGFETIQGGIARLSHLAHANLVTLCVSSSMATQLILPRLPKFREAHPSVDISLKIVNRDINPASENADFAFRLGDGKWVDLQSWPLFKEVYFPVCSPQLINGDPREVKIKRLESMNLLALQERFRKRAGWSEFFRLAGFPQEVIRTYMTFSDQETLLDAAIGGQGTGIGWLGVTNHCLSTGALVKVTDIEIETDQSFYLVAPEGIELSRSAMQFRDWFVEECRQIQAAWEAGTTERVRGRPILTEAMPRMRR